MRCERGQAGVETLIALPLVLLVVLAGAESVAWAVGSVLAADAARAGARAVARGQPAAAAARAELPGGARRFARVQVDAQAVRVVIRVPALVPGLPAFLVSARAEP